MNKDKIEELIAASKLGELLHKKEEEEEKNKCCKWVLIVLAVIGAVAAIADDPHTAFPLAIKNLKF